MVNALVIEYEVWIVNAMSVILYNLYLLSRHHLSYLSAVSFEAKNVPNNLFMYCVCIERTTERTHESSTFMFFDFIQFQSIRSFQSSGFILLFFHFLSVRILISFFIKLNYTTIKTITIQHDSPNVNSILWKIEFFKLEYN